MCLSVLVQGLPEWRKGYKVMAPTGGGGITFPCQAQWVQSVPIGEQLSEGRYRDEWVKELYADNCFHYPCGFHVFETLPAARVFGVAGDRIFEVEVDEPVARGYQRHYTKCLRYDLKVGVFRKMKLVKEVERK